MITRTNLVTIDYKKQLFRLFMDLSKVCDSECHNELIKHLNQNVGIKENVLALFKIIPRKQNTQSTIR